MYNDGRFPDVGCAMGSNSTALVARPIVLGYVV